MNLSGLFEVGSWNEVKKRATGFIRQSCSIFSTYNTKINKNIKQQMAADSSTIGYPEVGPELDHPVPEESEMLADLSESAQLAIMIDDFGNQWDTEAVQGFLNIEANVTIAILPGQWASRGIAETAREKGKEVVIHLPMEADHPTDGEERATLKRGMTSNQVDDLLKTVQKEIPEANGLNNHQGSGATQDSALMRELAWQCKKRNWYIVDSLTHPKSVMFREALEADALAARRDLFLDHVNDPEQIRANLYRAVRLAKIRQAPVVVIGHPRPATWLVLKEEIPKLLQENVHLIPMSQACIRKGV